MPTTQTSSQSTSMYSWRRIRSYFGSARAALLKGAVVQDADDLPEELPFDGPLPASACNVYGAMPPGLKFLGTRVRRSSGRRSKRDSVVVAP